MNKWGPHIYASRVHHIMIHLLVSYQNFKSLVSPLSPPSLIAPTHGFMNLRMSNRQTHEMLPRVKVSPGSSNPRWAFGWLWKAQVPVGNSIDAVLFNPKQLRKKLITSHELLEIWNHDLCLRDGEHSFKKISHYFENFWYFEWS